MKFQIISDLHIEKYGFKSFVREAENLIIAGDLGRIGKEYTLVIEYLCSIFDRVILVLGNHEYIGRDIKETENYFCILESTYENLFVLQNDTVELDGILIFGSTFWSHILSDPTLDIFVGTERISRLYWNTLHHQSITALENAIEISKKKNIPLVVVTHYSPLGIESVHPKHHSPNSFEKNLFYFSNTVLQYEKNIKKWIYGHTGHNYCTEKFISNQLECGGSLSFCINL